VNLKNSDVILIMRRQKGSNGAYAQLTEQTLAKHKTRGSSRCDAGIQMMLKKFSNLKIENDVAEIRESHFVLLNVSRILTIGNTELDPI